MKSFTKTTVKTFTPTWIKTSFAKFDDNWRRIRSAFLYKGAECFKCDGKFSEGESIALANFKQCGNKVLCEACAKQLSEP